MVRLKGCAVPGAVEVLGGAENVRAPREPMLKPPPTRASAVDIESTGSASARAIAIARRTPRMRCVNIIFVSFVPDMGKCP
jgi:hypothetical protein